jgi:HlyD family secretion protein
MKRNLIISLLVIAALAGGWWWFGQSSRSAAREETSPAAPLPFSNKVSALGRLEPAGGLIRLSAPTQVDGARVAKLLVREGDTVRSGQLIAVLDAEATKLAALNEARHQVELAEAKLAQTRAPAKASEIEAQRTVTARLQAELAQAEREYARYQTLEASGDIPLARLEGKRLAVDTLKAELARAQAQQTVLREYRQVDARVSEAEIAQARAVLARLAAELELTHIRAPQAGQVFRIHTRVGETIGAKGILDLGRTDQMYAVAEVYESDIARVAVGQRATITARSFAEPLKGSVELIGLQIGKKELISNDPAADADARVVEVKIKLDEASSRRVAALTNLRLEIVIE